MAVELRVFCCALELFTSGSNQSVLNGKAYSTHETAVTAGQKRCTAAAIFMAMADTAHIRLMLQHIPHGQ